MNGAPTGGDGAGPRFALIATGLAFLLTFGLTSLLGLERIWVSPDTASFLRACRAESCWGGARTPFYGWMLHGAGPRLLVGLQFAAMLWGALVLCAGVAASGASVEAAASAGITVCGSMMLLLWTRALLPEAFAHAALLAAFGCALLPRPLLAGLLTAGACLLKPALLPFLVVLPVIGVVLGGRRNLARLLFGCFAPIAVVVAIRIVAVGDANIVSFGGFQMSGIAALMLTPDLAHRLPAPLQGLALAIVERRDALAAVGAALPIPQDSHGARSFFSAALGYDDVLARAYDPVLYGAVRPLQMPNESWVQFNARLQHLAIGTIRRDPVGYAAWVAGGLARVIGRMVLFNPLLLASCAACLLLRRSDAGARRDRLVLGGLTASWLIGTVPPIVMLSFPAQRYVDSAGLMLPLLPCFLLLRGWRGRLRPKR